jgi:hypothetical protein
MVITVIEYNDSKREVLYTQEHITNRNARTYWFQDVSPEKLKEIQNASTDKVQSILSTL